MHPVGTDRYGKTPYRLAISCKAFYINSAYYSVRNAVTGSFLAAFLDGISPPIRVNAMLKRISTTAPTIGSAALTSVDPVKL